MPAFFILPTHVQDGLIRVGDDLFHHLRASLRCRPGDILQFTVAGVHRHRARVVSVDRRTLSARIEETTACAAPPHPRIALAPAIVKREAMEWLIQKATELGVDSIHPLLTRHSVVRPEAARAEIQRLRWQRIAIEAAQQSERWTVPVINQPTSLDQWIAPASSNRLILFLQERSDVHSLQAIPIATDVDELSLLVGPEGGWSDEERIRLQQAGMVPVGMGNLILRAETAAIAALSVLQSRLGHLGRDTHRL